ncbi:Glycoside hydrolase family 61 protein [Ceratobasidium theobromae]|uniref:AA9 family lytic polysaccharide monooxygenase n=1 Tax=Ceratobasidium theobromae TaxID=1582974 RepID=A0A5N5QHC5_9AGAM|nr:Glycoside hydrolase family 61 protein [Ceratobasidium theobromae]
MKFSTVAAMLASASAAYAHAIVGSVYINGVSQGNGVGTYIRSPPNNSPVKDLTSSDVACNVNNVAVPKTLEVSAGDVITFEWYHNTPLDDIIDASHKGPVQVYVAPTESNGSGAVWVKLFSQAYTDDWATNKLIANKGHVSVTVPDLAAGEYLFRPEIVALHEADTAYNVNSARGVQLYMECVQFKVASSGSVSLSGGIDFKESYTYSDGGLVFNVYNADPKTYVAPGGAVSSIAVAGQAGIGPVPAAGSNAQAGTTAAAVTSTSAAPATTAVPTTSTAAAVTSTAAPVTTASPVSTTRAAVSTSKMVTVTIRSSSAAQPTASAASSAAVSCPTSSSGSSGSSGAAVAKYYQCGGINYTGSTTCASGTTCVVQNPYYSQCL